MVSNKVAYNKYKSIRKAPFNTHATWLDKEDIVGYFHLSDRSLQKLRNGNEIVWSRIGGKFYYNLPSFMDLLGRNKKQ